MTLDTRAELAEFKTYLINTCQNAADVYVLAERKLLGNAYVPGENAYGYWHNSTARLGDTDCSGKVLGVNRFVDETCRAMGLPARPWLDGGPWRDMTADDIYQVLKDHKVPDGQERMDDVVIFGTSARKSHIASIVEKVNGVWHTIEARGKAWGVVEYTLPELKSRYNYVGVFRFHWLPDLEEPTVNPGGQRLLSLGMEGPDVESAQEQLVAHLGRCLEPNGYFGPETVEATRFFQRYKQIEIDGIVGPETKGKLDEQPKFAVLAQGSRGLRAIALLKWSLKRQGHGAGLRTWLLIFGPVTNAVVRRYQKVRGLKVDGIVGPITWGELREAR